HRGHKAHYRRALTMCPVDRTVCCLTSQVIDPQRQQKGPYVGPWCELRVYPRLTRPRQQADVSAQSLDPAEHPRATAQPCIETQHGTHVASRELASRCHDQHRPLGGMSGWCSMRIAVPSAPRIEPPPCWWCW